LLAAWSREEGVEVYLTTTTSTGYQLAKERYGAQTIGIGYFPLDWWGFSARAWRAVQPDLALLTEGERWPEHIHQAVCRGVPVVCVNARLSDRSFRRMHRFPRAVRRMLRGVTRVLACSEHDAERFRALGVPPDRIAVTGSIKLDVSIPALSAEALKQLRRELGLPAEGFVLMGASTWSGEEAALLQTLKQVRAQGLACSLLLVPRHAERRDEIATLLNASGWSHHFRSRGDRNGGGPIDVAVGDTTGELRKLLQVADVVFVGKSLPPHTEGQTPVESAILGRPILFGPGMGNFRVIARELVDCGAAQIVADATELSEQITALLGDPAQREVMSSAGRNWHQANVGAVERTLVALHSLT
jgi:3-deoxy-D-manno-octulosonic-acid transferase